MDRYIDDDSIVFEIVKYTILQVESKGEGMDFDNIKFTSKTLKYIFGNKIKEDDFKSRVISTIKKQIHENLISTRNKSMYITKKLLTKYYNI
tara:strand:- start:16157 stop:16432 length:276 start_codon:yes stop_codon:yes gene_type:complete